MSNNKVSKRKGSDLTPYHTNKKRKYNNDEWREMPLLNLTTSNIEKFGKSTSLNIRKKKVKEISKLVTQERPDIHIFQEVTNPELFLHGNRRNKGLMNTKQENSESLDFDYESLNGPSYVSGNYKESYPLIYNRNIIFEKPKLKYFQDNQQLEEYNNQPLMFGKKQSKPRPTTVWEFNVPIDRYNFRPPTKHFSNIEKKTEYEEKHSNLKHRKINTETIQLVNVHTSPSISTINKQVNNIFDEGDSLRQNNQNVILGGDFYMQRGAKRKFKELESDKNKRWALAAPKTNTNFPSKGEGQIADHFVASKKGFEVLSTKALTRPGKNKLSSWTKIDIDHAPVTTTVLVKRKKNTNKQNM